MGTQIKHEGAIPEVVTMTKHYVACDSCYAKGVQLKPDIKADGFITGESCTWRTFKDFFNGLLYEVPLCCNLNFCMLVRQGLLPAAVMSCLRGEEEWSEKHLTDVDKVWLSKKRGGVT